MTYQRYSPSELQEERSIDVFEATLTKVEGLESAVTYIRAQIDKGRQFHELKADQALDAYDLFDDIVKRGRVKSISVLLNGDLIDIQFDDPNGIDILPTSILSPSNVCFNRGFIVKDMHIVLNGEISLKHKMIKISGWVEFKDQGFHSSSLAIQFNT